MDTVKDLLTFDFAIFVYGYDKTIVGSTITIFAGLLSDGLVVNNSTLTFNILGVESGMVEYSLHWRFIVNIMINSNRRLCQVLCLWIQLF